MQWWREQDDSTSRHLLIFGSFIPVELWWVGGATKRQGDKRFDYPAGNCDQLTCLISAIHHDSLDSRSSGGIISLTNQWRQEDCEDPMLKQKMHNLEKMTLVAWLRSHRSWRRNVFFCMLFWYSWCARQTFREGSRVSSAAHVVSRNFPGFDAEGAGANQCFASAQLGKGGFGQEKEHCVRCLQKLDGLDPIAILQPRCS